MTESDITVSFVNVDSGVTELDVYPQLSSVNDYNIIESGISGEYEVEIEGRCVVSFPGSEPVLLENESEFFEIFAGQIFIVGKPGAELPTRTEARKEIM